VPLPAQHIIIYKCSLTGTFALLAAIGINGCAPRNILSMTMTMALVPSVCFEEALSFIQFEVDQISHDYPAVNDFLAHVHKTWLPLASKVSVFDCPVRTNNITESFHNIARKNSPELIKTSGVF